jgi:hypothetical protein
MLSLAVEQKEPHVYELKLLSGYQGNTIEVLLAEVTENPVVQGWSWKTANEVFAVWLSVKALPGMSDRVSSREDVQEMGRLFLDYLKELGSFLSTAKQWTR